MILKRSGEHTGSSLSKKHEPIVAQFNNASSINEIIKRLTDVLIYINNRKISTNVPRSKYKYLIKYKAISNR